MDNGKKSFRANNNSPKTPPRRGMRSIGFVALLILFGLIVFAAYGQSAGLKSVPLSDAVRNANSGQYAKIEVDGGQLLITKAGDKQATLRAYKDPNDSLKDIGLNAGKTEVSYKPQSSTGSTLANIGISLLPVILITV